MAHNGDFIVFFDCKCCKKVFSAPRTKAFRTGVHHSTREVVLFTISACVVFHKSILSLIKGCKGTEKP